MTPLPICLHSKTSSFNMSEEEKVDKDRQFVLDDLDKLVSRFSDHAPYQENEETKNSTENSLIRMFSPPGLEEGFKQLYSTLLPCLSSSVSTSDQETSSKSTSAILTGPRGVGKNLLLNSVLAACKHQYPTAKFRQVLINGIVCRGSDVSAVIYEIIRQLSELAFQEAKEKETKRDKSDSAGDQDNDEGEVSHKRRRLEDDADKYLLRLRNSNFSSNLSLLESTLKIAAIDRIPILLVLDELDCFAEQDERQVLLYHLLDRVATPDSSLYLVGITTNYDCIGYFEKRIKSRVEGVAKLIFVRKQISYEKGCLDIVRQKFGGSALAKSFLTLISKPSSNSSTDNDANHKSHSKVWSTMQREYCMYRDTRWIGRVCSTALALYRQDVEIEDSVPELQPRHLIDALVMLGAQISDAGAASATRQPSLNLMVGQAVDPRLQAMLDMSKPEVALLLAARRILMREAHREQTVSAPLTIQRMLKEYESSFRRGAQRSEPLLPAALQLLERGILSPSMDHSGGGGFQYHMTHVFKILDPYSLVRLPLHLPVSVETELENALGRNLFDCSTALREWGRKVN